MGGLKCIGVISRENHPLFIKSIGNFNDKNKHSQEEELKYHFMIYTSLDLIEEKIGASLFSPQGSHSTTQYSNLSQHVRTYPYINSETLEKVNEIKSDDDMIHKNIEKSLPNQTSLALYNSFITPSNYQASNPQSVTQHNAPLNIDNQSSLGFNIGGQFLGPLYSLEDYKVYGFVTNTQVKFVIVVDSEFQPTQNDFAFFKIGIEDDKLSKKGKDKFKFALDSSPPKKSADIIKSYLQVIGNDTNSFDSDLRKDLKFKNQPFVLDRHKDVLLTLTTEIPLTDKKDCFFNLLVPTVPSFYQTAGGGLTNSLSTPGNFFQNFSSGNFPLSPGSTDKDKSILDPNITSSTNMLEFIKCIFRLLQDEYVKTCTNPFYSPSSSFESSNGTMANNSFVRMADKILSRFGIN
ncbi:unnamed protein product [Gordionus sp. m RMFG-2023]